MKKTIRTALLASVFFISFQTLDLIPAFAASTSLSSAMFQDTTGLNASTQDIQSTWNALKTMGTDKFLGGNIGSFKLDESSMIAGALTIGATEFDNFLRSGSLSNISGDLSSLLSTNMTKAAGIDLSSVVGSFTQGGGAAAGTVFNAASTSATGTGGQCSPGVASDLVNIGKKHVDMMRNAALGGEFGVSQISSLAGSNGVGTGFASLGCLDKLFQNAGSDILFKPPSLSNLISQLQNWACPNAPGVSQQVMGDFGDLGIFDTQAMGGFYGHKVFGESNDGPVSPQPGIGNNVQQVFGSGFGNTQIANSAQISQQTSLTKLFQ